MCIQFPLDVTCVCDKKKWPTHFHDSRQSRLPRPWPSPPMEGRTPSGVMSGFVWGKPLESQALILGQQLLITSKIQFSHYNLLNSCSYKKTRLDLPTRLLWIDKPSMMMVRHSLSGYVLSKLHVVQAATNQSLVLCKV